MCAQVNRQHKAQKEIWLVSGLKDHRYLSVTQRTYGCQLAGHQHAQRCNRVSPRLCDIPSGSCFFTGPWTVTRSSLRMLRRVAAFCRPLPPVLLLVSFPRPRQHRGWPGQPAPSLPGARATPAQPASDGGCLPRPRWAVCAKGGGTHQGQTSRERERDDKGPPAHTPHQHQQPTHGRPGPPHPNRVPPSPTRQCAQQEHWPSRRPSDPTGGVGWEIGLPVGQQGP